MKTGSWRGGASEPRRRAQQQGCRGQSGEIPIQRITANQNSPGRNACLLTRQGRWGLRAEAWAFEVRSQGEDWGWLREHSLKVASAPQLAGRESRKKSGPAQEARDHCFRVHRRGDSFPMCPQKAEYHLSKLQRWAQAAAISSDPRDGHETLRLLLPPPRILCATTGHYPHPHPPGACAARHCQGPVIQGQLPWENTWHASGCCNVMAASATAGSPRISIMTTVPHPLPGLSEQECPNQPLI